MAAKEHTSPARSASLKVRSPPSVAPPPPPPETPLPALISKRDAVEFESLSPFSRVLLDAKAQQHKSRLSQVNWTSSILPMPMKVAGIPPEVEAEVKAVCTPTKSQSVRSAVGPPLEDECVLGLSSAKRRKVIAPSVTRNQSINTTPYSGAIAQSQCLHTYALSHLCVTATATSHVGSALGGTRCGA